MRAHEFISEKQDQEVNEFAPLLVGALARAAGGALTKAAGSAVKNVASGALSNLASAASNVVGGVASGIKSIGSTASKPANTMNATAQTTSTNVTPQDIVKLSGKQIDSGIPELGKIKIGRSSPQGIELSLANPNVKLGQMLGPKFIVPTK